MGFAQNSLISCIYDMALRHSTWDNILDILKASLPECLILVYGDDLAAHTNVAFAQRGLDAEAASSFVNTYAAQNPWLTAQAQLALEVRYSANDKTGLRDRVAAVLGEAASHFRRAFEISRRARFSGGPGYLDGVVEDLP